MMGPTVVTRVGTLRSSVMGPTVVTWVGTLRSSVIGPRGPRFQRGGPKCHS